MPESGGDAEPAVDGTTGDASPGDSGNGGSDAGLDGSIEAGADGSLAEAGSDAGIDASVESGADGSLEAGLDASFDSPSSDAGADGATGPDAGEEEDAAGDGGSTSDAGDASNAGDGSDGATPKMVVYASGVTVSTLAGNGSYGDLDGQDASFSNPTGIALYGSGVIVVENDTGEIRIVTATGNTTTIAMSPIAQAQTSPFTIVSAPQGYYYSTDFDQGGLHVDGGGGVWSFVPDDAGSGTSTLIAGGFYVPRTLVPLPNGEIFVFDTATSSWAPVTEEVAESLNPIGPTVSLIAGQRGQIGFANGDGGAALFGSPTVGGVLLPDGSGVVVADCGNKQLRFIALDGTVSTYAGSTTAGWVDGPKATALFSCPHALAIDSAGNIYVSDGNNNAIRRVSSAGNVTTLAGTGVQGYADGPGDVAEFYGAEGIVVSADGTTLFVADGTSGNGSVPYNRIRAITLPALDGG
jgi:sugar lactone lactonase YvrE